MQTLAINGTKASAHGILAKLKDPGKARAAALANTMERQNLKVGHNFKLVPGLQRLIPKTKGKIRAFDENSIMKTIKELRKTGLFEYVEPDWIVHALQSPPDSAFTDGTLWGLRNTGQNGGTAGIDINAVSAWEVNTGSPKVVVAVIDTGIRYTHQDLSANMWVNPDEIPGNGIDDDGNGYVDDIHGINAINGSGDPFDDDDHGSHVAGTIAASANDAGRHVGAAYNVELMGLKFLGPFGGSTSDAITCIEYAVAAGADITNNSWGGGDFSQALLDAIQAANDAGLLFVAAAGNDASNNDTTSSYPANYDVPNVISVAAIDRNGTLASFSNFGADSVDIGAPGFDILSSTATSDSSYASFSGTSMAAPHVAGAAALVVSEFSGIGIAELRARLLNTSVPLPSLAGSTVTGGMVDAHGALIAATDGTLELRASSDGPLQEGSSADFFISVSDLSPVTTATVTGNFDSEGSVGFLDDGISPDVTANDGVYSASLGVPIGVNPVNLNVSADAPGKTSASEVFTFDVLSPPQNDDFADRIALEDGTTQTSGTNEFASSESGEPINPSGAAGGRTVWWSWTAPFTGSTTITTIGSNYDTTLAIYEGNSLGGLSLLGANDDSSGLQSAVTFTAVSGTTYQIQVDGWSSSQGDIQLNYPDPGLSDQVPVIVTQPVGRSVAIGDPFSLSVLVGGSEPLEYQWFLDGNPITGATAATYSVATADETDAGDYTVTITNPVGSASSNPAFVDVLSPPQNDDFADRIALAQGTTQTSGTNVVASSESGEPINPVFAGDRTVWWSWTSSFTGNVTITTTGSNYDTTLAIYEGDSLGGLSLLGANDDSSGLQSAVTFAAVSGTNYQIQVDGFSSSQGDIQLNYPTPGGGGDIFADWATAAGLTGNDALPEAQPFDDGVTNLEKFAFNMDGSGPDTRQLTPGVGTAGLPVLVLESDPAGTIVRFEFLRRKDGEVIYNPQQSDNLEEGSWQTTTGSLEVLSIDASWERVTIEQILDPEISERFFRLNLSTE